jgi:hypothetical protein
MMTPLRRLGSWWDRGATLWNALGLLLVLVSAINVASDASRRLPDAVGYAVADNLIVVCAAVGFVLALVSPPIRLTGAADTWSRQGRLAASAIFGGAVLLVVLGGIRALWGGASLHDLAVSAMLGTGVGMLAFALLRPDESPPGDAPVPARPMWVYAPLAAALIVSVVLRHLAPGSTVQTWIVAPVQGLVAPGIGLGLALLPREAGWPERVIAALPLGITAQILGLLWCDLLGIPAGWLTFTLLGALVTFGGLIAEIIARRRGA